MLAKFVLPVVSQDIMASIKVVRLIQYTSVLTPLANHTSNLVLDDLWVKVLI